MDFDSKLQLLLKRHQTLIERANKPHEDYNGIFTRYQYPVLTAEHTPIFWRYDLNRSSNPFLQERYGINSVFNAGAIEKDNKILLVVRVEGYNRKSFFAIAESTDGVSRFRFRDYPVTLPETNDSETNVYDMRLTRHEDGWIYGLFCSEKKDPSAPEGDTTCAVAGCGIVRTRDLINWERLPDLKTQSAQQRNVVLHPEFVKGKYGLYTRPQDSFIEAGSGGGIGWALTGSMEKAEIDKETIIDPRIYHTIKELKNGQGPAPLKTKKGWLHLAHGVRACAAGLRYVLYMFMTDLNDPSRIIYRPGGYFMAPKGSERIGDVSNVLFCNGWVARNNGTVYIYYASSDTQLHVAESSIDKLVDYTINTPEDRYTSAGNVETICQIIKKNFDTAKRNDLLSSNNLNT